VNPPARQAAPTLSVDDRARLSLGASSEAIYGMVTAAMAARHGRGGLLLDVGCGGGRLWQHVRHLFSAYLGADAVRYDGFPEDGTFLQTDLDAGHVPVGDGTADVVAAVEVIEHLENPRAFMRELARLAKPGGCVVVTTPNQLSLLSKLTLLLKNQFNAFQEAPGMYPTHITALLEIDLVRIAAECGLVDPVIGYSLSGRIIGTRWHHPRLVSKLRPRAFSDNVILLARKPPPG
jgi:SAM-dependent methyltransferase